MRLGWAKSRPKLVAQKMLRNAIMKRAVKAAQSPDPGAEARGGVYVISMPLTMLTWLAVVLIGSAVASAVPAWRTSRLTIRETLAYI